MKLRNILLIATDTSDIRDIKDALAEHEVVICNDVLTAPALCEQHDIYLVIVEEELPRQSGSDLFVELRKKRPWLAGLLLTEAANESALRRALDIGFTGLLEKPVDSVHLLQRIYRAMESACLQEENTRLRTILPLYKYGERFLSSTTEQEVFDTLVEIVAEVTEATRVSVMWFRETDGCLRIVAAKGLDQDLAESIRLQPGDQIAGWVYQYGRPVILNRDTQDQSIFAPILQQQNISAAVSFPITMHKEISGVLNISQAHHDTRFSEADIEMLVVICGQAAMALANVRFRHVMQEKTRVRTLFEQYVAPEVADLLISSGSDLMGVGELKKATIFFADIRESTSLVQHLDLTVLRTFLNEFFQIFTEVIFDQRGTIDKFMGDAVLAVFGAPVELENPDLSAVQAAYEISRRFKELRLRWITEQEEFEKIGLAIGVSSGEVFLGNVGSAQRFDYTALGSAVNLAQRVASASPSGNIHVTGEVVDQIVPHFEIAEVGFMKLRGLEKKFSVFSVGQEKFL